MSTALTMDDSTGDAGAREFLILVRAHAQRVADLKAGATETTISGGKKKNADEPKKDPK